MKAKKDSLIWEDIIFENKHRAYGAYVLRKNYNRYLFKAAIIASGSLILGLATPKILSVLETKDSEIKKELVASVQYMELAPPPPIQKEMTPPPKAPEVQKVVKYVPPKVTKEEVVEEKELPTIEEIKNNQIGTVDVEGKEGLTVENPVVVDEGNGLVSDQVFDFVEESPEYPGGMEALFKFLQRNLRYPSRAQRMGMEGTVYVSFIVDQHGAITNVEVRKGFDAACDEEAVRVIRKMPVWKAGKQGGNAVKVRYMLPIKFKLST